VAKKYWKCKICGDIHWGVATPGLCPTCKQKDAYVEIGAAEAKRLMGL